MQGWYWFCPPKLLLSEELGHLWTATAVEQVCSHMHKAAVVWPGTETENRGLIKLVLT